MALTRIGLVNFVLNQAGLDSSYQVQGRTWLNIVREKLSNRTDYKFWRTSTTIALIAGQSSYSLPADFLKSDAAFNIDQYGKQGNEILLFEPYKFEPIPFTSNGGPSAATINEATNTIQFDASPASGTTGKFLLYYFKKPTDYSLDSTDDNVIPDFKDQDVLIQEMMKIAYEHLDDERYGSKMAEVRMAHVEHRRNIGQSEGTSTMDLSRQHFRGRRRGF